MEDGVRRERNKATFCTYPPGECTTARAYWGRTCVAVCSRYRRGEGECVAARRL